MTSDSTDRVLVSQGSTFEERIGYSRAVADGPWAFVSGTTGYDYATMTIDPDVVVQCDQALRNIEAALAAADFSMADIVRVRYLFPERGDFEPCWPLLHSAFETIRPAATLQVCGLADPAMRIEIEATAYRRPATA